MDESKRILPEMVIEAYKATRLMPIQGAFTRFIHKRKCACGISVVAIHKGMLSFDDFNSSKIEELLGLSDLYTAGFIQAFDCVPLAGNHELQELGYTDGTACRNAIWNENGECLI